MGLGSGWADVICLNYNKKNILSICRGLKKLVQCGDSARKVLWLEPYRAPVAGNTQAYRGDFQFDLGFLTLARKT